MSCYLKIPRTQKVIVLRITWPSGTLLPSNRKLNRAPVDSLLQTVICLKLKNVQHLLQRSFKTILFIQGDHNYCWLKGLKLVSIYGQNLTFKIFLYDKQSVSVLPIVVIKITEWHIQPFWISLYFAIKPSFVLATIILIET